MFPASSAANYWLHFFLSLLGCFRCPHQVLPTQPAARGCASGLAGWGRRGAEDEQPRGEGGDTPRGRGPPPPPWAPPVAASGLPDEDLLHEYIERHKVLVSGL